MIPCTCGVASCRGYLFFETVESDSSSGAKQTMQRNDSVNQNISTGDGSAAHQRQAKRQRC